MRGKEASGPFPETIFNFSSLQLPAFAKIPASAAPRSAIRLRESPARGNHSLLAEHEGAWEIYPLARSAWRDFQQRCVDISSASCSFTVSNVFFFVLTVICKARHFCRLTPRNSVVLLFRLRVFRLRAVRGLQSPAG